MKLSPTLEQALQNELTQTYLKGKEDGIAEGRKMERESVLEDAKRVNQFTTFLSRCYTRWLIFVV